MIDWLSVSKGTEYPLSVLKTQITKSRPRSQTNCALAIAFSEAEDMPDTAKVRVHKHRISGVPAIRFSTPSPENPRVLLRHTLVIDKREVDRINIFDEDHIMSPHKTILIYAGHRRIPKYVKTAKRQAQVNKARAARREQGRPDKSNYGKRMGLT